MELLKIIAKYKTAPLNNYTDHEGGLELWWITKACHLMFMRVQ